MSHANLATYPEIALVIFLWVFLLVALRVLFSSRKEMDAVARIPLSDEPVSPRPRKNREETP
jgi:hypothetical protein